MSASFIEPVTELISFFWTYLKFPAYVFSAYMVSQILEFFLDKFLKKLRFDKWILYALLIKSILVKTKVTYFSQRRPNLNEMRGKIQTEFKEGLDTNEPPRGGAYIFKIKRHPISFKIMVMEPSEQNHFTITLETHGQEKMSKFFLISFNKTINIFERVTRILEDLELQQITAQIEVVQLTEDKRNVGYQYTLDSHLSPQYIQINSKDFSNVGEIIRDCLREWRVLFL